MIGDRFTKYEDFICTYCKSGDTFLGGSHYRTTNRETCYASVSLQLSLPGLYFLISSCPCPFKVF